MADELEMRAGTSLDHVPGDAIGTDLDEMTSNNEIVLDIVLDGDDTEKQQQEQHRPVIIQKTVYQNFVESVSTQFGFNLMSQEEIKLNKQLEQSVILSKIHWACSKEDVYNFIHKDEECYIQIDPLKYDIIKEAETPISFNINALFEDIFINLFSPFSFFLFIIDMV
mmetsp:Transcript_13696/g.16302  ORF Transcript_13696/g.16302 Transcript_13696/m.16302 type:complete len:167 (-) Transcript_13696:6-506(-)